MMNNVVNKIKELIQQNAVHNRKHFHLGNVQHSVILKHAQEELTELTDNPNDMSEMGDLLAILLHYCLMKNWSFDKLEEQMINKLNERFSSVHVNTQKNDK